MAYNTGKSKSLDDITLDDAIKNPIWEWALDEEKVEGQDETWQRPILDTDNVTSEIISPTITLKVKGEDTYASAEYDHESEGLSGIAIWIDGGWKFVNDYSGPVPIIFVSVPKINGVANIEFILEDLNSDTAIRC